MLDAAVKLPIPGAGDTKQASLETPRKQNREEKTTAPASVTIQNLYVQAEDCKTVFDFVRMIMHITNNPQEVMP
jgi:hypothetical protein